MKNWLAELAAHYEATRYRHPEQKLLIFFDIDGTILDMRCMIHHVLHRYDHLHTTRFFENLVLTDIDVHENEILPLLSAWSIPPAEYEKILTWYEAWAWSSTAMLEAHKPFSGVLEVIRWFQMQPNTYVGLNTARPERMREDTLRSLNQLGATYQVNFNHDLVYMRPNDWGEAAPRAKALGVEQFRQAGFHVFAFVDNEPDNLAAISQIDPAHDILLLHAHTIFRSNRTELPSRAVVGHHYDLADLIRGQALRQAGHFAWNTFHDHLNQSNYPYR
jgi:beta-phosphoglucomutase-like phosphatase (HAD superfamily)